MVWLWQMQWFYGRASAQLFVHDSVSASGHLATGQLRHRQRLATMCGILTCLPMSVQVLAKIVATDCLQKAALKKGGGKCDFKLRFQYASCANIGVMLDPDA